MLALKYSLRVVGVEMSKHNAKVAAKRAKVALKTVSKEKKEMGVLWRQAYDMCRRHRIRRVFRAWRGPRSCDRCCTSYSSSSSSEGRRENVPSKDATSWIKNKDSGGVRSIPVFIGPDTTPDDLWKFVGVHKREDRAVLVGLHPCGDLSCALLRLFMRGGFKGMCLVSCCYHLLRQEQNKCTYRNFPTSNHLLKRRADASPIGQCSFNLACHMFRMYTAVYSNLLK